MLCFKALFISLALFAGCSLATPAPLTPQVGPVCEEMTIDVSVTAKNYLLAGIGLSTLQNEDALTNLLAGIVNTLFSVLNFFIQDKIYRITGRYCEPEVFNASRTNTLQFLSHPATYDRNYWSGGVYPGSDPSVEQYSWVSYASKLGYPTFAIDRLGNGNSSHPNSIFEVQCPAQAATIHELIVMIKSGRRPFPRTFTKVIYVGGSMGSIIGNVINQLYPDDVDATILTGFSKFWATVIPGFTITAKLLPAALVDSGRYGYLMLDAGYLIATNPAGTAYLLFYGPGEHYNETFIAQDYDNRGTITVGEAVSGGLGIAEAPRYRGSVYIMTGQKDVVFCGTTAFPLDGPGECITAASNRLEETASLYPAASDYSWIALPNAGHCWEHQYVAQYGFQQAHIYLEEQRF